MRRQHLLGLLLNILPLAAGAAITPTILLVQLRNVAGRGGSQARGLAYAAGCAAVLLVDAALALGLADRTGGAESSPGAVAAVKLTIAALLGFYGIRALLRARSPRGTEPYAPSSPSAPAGAPRLIGLGAAMMATNFTSLALFFPAVHEIGISAAGLAAQLVAFGLLLALTMLPATAPLLPSRALHDTLRPRLERADQFLERHQRRLIPVVALLLGAYLAVQGLAKLL